MQQFFNKIGKIFKRKYRYELEYYIIKNDFDKIKTTKDISLVESFYLKNELETVARFFHVEITAFYCSTEYNSAKIYFYVYNNDNKELFLKNFEILFRNRVSFTRFSLTKRSK